MRTPLSKRPSVPACCSLFHPNYDSAIWKHGVGRLIDVFSTGLQSTVNFKTLQGSFAVLIRSGSTFCSGPPLPSMTISVTFFGTHPLSSLLISLSPSLFTLLRSECTLTFCETTDFPTSPVVAQIRLRPGRFPPY